MIDAMDKLAKAMRAAPAQGRGPYWIRCPFARMWP